MTSTPPAGTRAPDKKIRRKRKVARLGKLNPDDVGRWLAKEKEKPLRKAIKKFEVFVNECVTDKDFLSGESRSILDLLLLVRDTLLDGITRKWTLDDLLFPIVEEIRKQQSKNANEAKNEQRLEIRYDAIGAWLALSPEERRSIGRVRFSESQARACKEVVTASVIRKEYLSKTSIQTYLEKFPTPSSRKKTK